MPLEEKDLRWWILNIADKAYPREVSERTVSLTLAEVRYPVGPGELATHLAYLEEKGYVERSVVKSRELGEERALVRLTAKGKDLLEGNIPADPGIDTSGKLGSSRGR
jgi:DNA-binding PadR family transcriptional regulator